MTQVHCFQGLLQGQNIEARFPWKYNNGSRIRSRRMHLQFKIFSKSELSMFQRSRRLRQNMARRQLRPLYGNRNVQPHQGKSYEKINFLYDPPPFYLSLRFSLSHCFLNKFFIFILKAIAWHPWRSGLLAIGEGLPGSGSLSIWNVNTSKMEYMGKPSKPVGIKAVEFNKLSGELVYVQWVQGK